MVAQLIPIRPIETAEAPKANLSGSEIAAPFNTMSAGFEKLGDAADATARALAKDAGRDAVRVDDSGNLVVDKAPIFGPASQEFEHAAVSSYLSKIQPKIENKMLEMRLEDPYNFEGFKAKADSYGKELTSNISDPHLKDAVGDIVSQNAAHNWRSMYTEANQKNLADFVSDSQATLKSITEKRGSLARQGGMWLDDKDNLQSTPEFAGLTKDYQRIIGNLVADPRTKYSTERANLEIKEQGAADFVQMKIGEVQRQFMKDHDLAKATQSLQDAFHGPGSERWNLTNQQRDRGVSEGLQHLKNLEAGSHDAIAEFRRSVTSYEANIKAEPNSFDNIQHGNMVARAEAIKDYRSIGDLQQIKTFQPVIASLKAMGPDERATALQQMYRGIVPGTAPPPAGDMMALGKDSAGFFAARGGSARFAGMNPEFAGRLRSAIQDAEAATGEKTQINSLTRTTGEQAAAFARYQSGQGGLAAPPGHSRHEVGEAADIQPGKVLDFLHQNADKYGLEFLKGRAFSADPVHIQMGRGGLTPGSTVDLGADNATARLFQSTVKDLRERVGKDADKAATEIDTVLKQGGGFAPGQLEYFGRLAALSGREDLAEKIRPALLARDAKAGLPEGTSPTALHAEIEAAKKQGLPTVARQAADMLDADFKRDYEQMHTDPLTYGGAAGWHGKIGSLDTKNPDAFGSEIVSREKNLQVDQQHIRDLGPKSLLSPEEGKSVATALTAGDPQVAAKLLTVMQGGASHDNWRATMASDPIKNAITDMARSNDPARQDAGMMTLDKLWSTNAPEFDKTYGEATLTRMLAWKGLQALTPQERVERLNKADDPFMAEGRAKMAKAVEKEFESWTPADVAYQLGTSAGIPLLSRAVNPVTQATPAAPVDGAAAFAMQAQFEATVKSLRMYSVDPDNAKRLTIERMKAQWQPSRLAAGDFGAPVLMKHAPEAHYPAVDGSHDWMQRDLDGFVSKVYGDKFDANAGAPGGFEAPPMIVAKGWTMKSIVSDARTEQEIAAGKPPSYRIHILDAKGQDQFVRDPETGQDRIRWNPTDVQAGYVAKQKGTFDRMQSVRDYQGMTGPM